MRLPSNEDVPRKRARDPYLEAFWEQALQRCDIAERAVRCELLRCAGRAPAVLAAARETCRHLLMDEHADISDIFQLRRVLDELGEPEETIWVARDVLAVAGVPDLARALRRLVVETEQTAALTDAVHDVWGWNHGDA